MFEKFGRSLDQFMQALSKETGATPIEPKTDPISADYPAGDNPSLRLEISVGKTALTPGGAKLVDGSVTYNVAEWAPRVVTDGSRVTVKQDVGMHMVGAWGEMRNDWSLALGTARPFGLSIGKGAGEAKIELGGVPLTSVQMELGAGKVHIGFSKLNPSQCSAVKLNVGAGTLSVDELLNANAESIVFGGGAGELTLNFTGAALQRSMTAKLNTGAGKLVLNVQRGVACKLAVSKLLGSVHVPGDFRPTGSDSFESASYRLASGPTLTIEVNTAVSDITLNEVG